MSSEETPAADATKEAAAFCIYNRHQVDPGSPLRRQRRQQQEHRRRTRFILKVVGRDSRIQNISARKAPPRDEEATKSSPLWQSVDCRASFLVFSLSHHILLQSLHLVVENFFFFCDCCVMEARANRMPSSQLTLNSACSTPQPLHAGMLHT